MAALVGQIYRDAAFYIDTDGAPQSKYLLVLAAPPRSDIVFRLLTSRHAASRPEDPRCYHGHPYAGFFLGVLGGNLGEKSWLDLRRSEDFDRWDFARRQESGGMTEIMRLPAVLMRPAFECVAAADDTTREQERLIRDVVATLPI